MTLQGVRIHVSGIVQGVGFRPFVYSLATRFRLTGWVRNTSAGVDIELDGDRETLEAFTSALNSEAPALAHIDTVEVFWQPANGFSTFEITHSEAEPSAFQPISPDVSICADCLRELFDPQDRRYRYPFINCTNCGPRFTIIQDVPYDRPNTSMSIFPMCAQCAAEYQDPLDRRFHAQPVACPDCGPHIWLEQAGALETAKQGETALRQAQALLREGKILAIKGLGGFHLACDATNRLAVEELRRRKLRVDKPFALMAANIEVVQTHCMVGPAEQSLLENRQRPILILPRRPESSIAPETAPRQNTIGVMLPYTPLHYLLFANLDQQPAALDMPPLVMTSGNLSEEPICTDNDTARQQLASLADAFLMHNRPIHIRCDDSVARTFPTTHTELQKGEKPSLYPIRRARGYAPDPVRLSFEVPPLLATGAELKNTFCLTRGRYAFLSHHIGDMENNETLLSFEQGIAHFERLFRIQPEALAFDMHPNYLATRYALERAERECLPAIGVQHHHAHIAACMAENGLSGERPVIGVAFDGTGYGEDGAIWGGEFLVATYKYYQRVARLMYARLPGGDKAVREPWRMALAWLQAAGIPWEQDLPPMQHALSLVAQPIPPIKALHSQLETGINAPLTSSMGRLFDAAAALIGVRQTVNYEAQAAIELETLADERERGYYALALNDEVIDPAPLWQGMIADLRSGADLPIIAARFHNGIARMVVETCSRLRQQLGVKEVALSGGVWQNRFLLSRTVELLENTDFKVYLHRQIPANDGGLSLGQALVAIAQLKN